MRAGAWPVLLVLVLALVSSRTAHADTVAPSQKAPRHRTCCAFASELPLHLGSAHVPLTFGIVTSARSIGEHSYSGDAAGHETNGLVYTRHGGFVDTGHTREYADATAHLAVRLRPLLAHGGVLRLGRRDAELRLHVLHRVPESDREATSVLLARRITFQIGIWVEITQHYGHAMMRGAEELFSAFTPEDLYSNLLGTALGGAAVTSPLPYDRAMDALLADAFASLDAMPAAETRRILTALAGRWWRSGVPWPSPAIPILRSFDIGPHVTPLLAPADVVAPAAPTALDVPEVDGAGAPLAELYRLEIVPDLRALPRFASTGSRIVNADDLPRLVAGVRASIEAGDEVRVGPHPVDDPGNGPLAHYVVGLRLLDLKASGGIAGQLEGASKGVGGGALVGVRGDTRGGDFALVRLDVNHTAARGLSPGFSLFKSDALFFCRDRDDGRLRAPLVSLLGPCDGGEWLGLGGSVGEALHDGRTGRTALRPVSLYGVLDLAGNGQSPSYDGVRLLLRGGGAVEHVWTQLEGPTTIPRAGGNALILLRTPDRTLEAYGGAGYRLDPTTPRDAAFESNLSLRWYFLLGGNRSSGLADGIDPWGVGSLGLEGGYSFWTRPLHSYPELGAPFVSAEHSATWQLLVTATLGFEGLTF
ncbi:MAG: Uncharacterized protein JWP87_2211 [Labilithrix sp.]|nr:Uncharacterized protein [Labilithrix sp.]